MNLSPEYMASLSRQSSSLGGIRSRNPAQRAISGLLVSAAWWCAAVPCLPAHAEGNKAAAQAVPEKSTKAEPERLTFNLGRFEIREVRTAREETTKISFVAYFAMSPDVSKEDLLTFEHRKHRLRDQVIIAVRAAQNLDFQEPELQRLRRLILFRVRRLLKEDVVQDILLSEFTFATE